MHPSERNFSLENNFNMFKVMKLKKKRLETKMWVKIRHTQR